MTSIVIRLPDEVLAHGASTERRDAAYRRLDLAPSESFTECPAVEVMVTHLKAVCQHQDELVFSEPNYVAKGSR